jgi:hypothetical protein
LSTVIKPWFPWMGEISWLGKERLSSQNGFYSKESKIKPAGTIFVGSHAFCCSRRMFEVLLWCPPFSIDPIFYSSSVNIRKKFISAVAIFLSFPCFVTKLSHPLRSTHNFIQLSFRTLSRLISERPHCICALINSVNNVHSNRASYPFAWHIKFITLEEINTVITLIKFRM